MALSDIVRVANDEELVAATNIIENLVKISHSVILWGLTHQLGMEAVWFI